MGIYKAVRRGRHDLRLTNPRESQYCPKQQQSSWRATIPQADMTAIKLFAVTGACSLAAHILLNELGVQYEIILNELKDGVPEEAMKLNPKKKVPVLEIDGQVITENVAILTAIAQLAPEKSLLGKTDFEKFRVYEYLSYLSGTLHGQAFTCIFRPGTFTNDESAFKSVKQKGIEMALKSCEYIETGLSGVYAVGNQLTVVDPYLLVFWFWGIRFLNTDMHARFPKYAALIKELQKRESVQKTLRQEGFESASRQA